MPRILRRSRGDDATGAENMWGGVILIVYKIRDRKRNENGNR